MGDYTDRDHSRLKHELVMHARRGQTLPMVAVAIVVLLGAAGFAVDTGYHQYHQRMQQTATDSAAIAAAAELGMNDAQAAARQDAANNGYTDNTGQSNCPSTPSIGTVCVVVNHPPVSPDLYSNTAAAVEVQITVYHPTFFEKIFGLNKVPVTTKAVAISSPQTSNNCMYVLNGQANFNAQTTGGTGSVNAPQCGLMFNQAANFHSSTVNAAAINCAASCSGGTYTQATPQPSAASSDPCPFISYCAYLATNQPPCATQQLVGTVTNGMPITLSPGCYGSSSGPNFSKLKNASTVTFTCGLYVINGVTLSISTNPNATQPININQTCALGGAAGVTFYVENGGSIVLNNDNISLTAPTSGDYSLDYSTGEQNTLIYNPGSGNITIQSASCVSSCQSFFSGMIYTPNSTLNYNQYNTTNTGAVLIITGTLNANGGINNIIGPGGGAGITVQVPLLVE